MDLRTRSSIMRLICLTKTYLRQWPRASSKVGSGSTDLPVWRQTVRERRTSGSTQPFTVRNCPVDHCSPGSPSLARWPEMRRIRADYDNSKKLYRASRFGPKFTVSSVKWNMTMSLIPFKMWQSNHSGASMILMAITYSIWARTRSRRPNWKLWIDPSLEGEETSMVKFMKTRCIRNKKMVKRAGTPKTRTQCTSTGVTTWRTIRSKFTRTASSSIRVPCIANWNSARTSTCPTTTWSRKTQFWSISAIS